MKLLWPVFLGFAALPHSVVAQSLPEKRFPEIVYYANAYADHYHVPRPLVHAVIPQESGWNRDAQSRAATPSWQAGTALTKKGTPLKEPQSIEGALGEAKLRLPDVHAAGESEQIYFAPT